MIRMMVADDNALIRENICRFIQTQAGMKVIAQARNGSEVIRSLEQHRPDILLLDIEMPGMSGIDVLRAIREKGFAVDIVIVSGYSDSELIRGVFDLGAKGFVVKEDLVNSLPRAIQTIRENGQPFLSRQAKLSTGDPNR